MSINYKSSSTFLAKEVDDLFINGFGFNENMDLKFIGECFRWVKNCLYMVCFEKPEKVLWFEYGFNGLIVYKINFLKAKILGQVIIQSLLDHRIER